MRVINEFSEAEQFPRLKFISRDTGITVSALSVDNFERMPGNNCDHFDRADKNVAPMPRLYFIIFFE